MPAMGSNGKLESSIAGHRDAKGYLLDSHNPGQAGGTGKAFDWIVIRNRLAHLGNRNSELMTNLLNQLAPRLGFRTAPGFGERVIFRELFPKGLTLLDPQAGEIHPRQAHSRAAARDEVWALLNAIGLEESPQARSEWDRKISLDLSGSRFATT